MVILGRPEPKGIFLPHYIQVQYNLVVDLYTIFVSDLVMHVMNFFSLFFPFWLQIGEEDDPQKCLDNQTTIRADPCQLLRWPL